MQNLAAEAYRGEGVVFFNRRSIGGICVQVVRRGRRQKSRSTIINRSASQAQSNQLTNDPPRRLRKPSTEVPQPTDLLDDFVDQVSGYHEHERPQRLRISDKSDIWLIVRSKSRFSWLEVRASAVQYPYEPLPFYFGKQIKIYYKNNP